MDKQEELIAQKELDRRQGWLQISKDQRVAVRRLHTMMGHCSNQALIRLLRASMADKKVIAAAQHFRCPSCDEVKKTEQPRETRPLRPDHQLRFNHEVSIDVFEVHDCREGRHAILSMVDMATRYHIAVRVGGGGTPSSHVCAEALNLAWITPFGAPTVIVSDQGVHNKGKLNALLPGHGVEVRRTGVQAAHQLGTGERQGGILKEMMIRAIHSKQLHGAEMMTALCAESARTKNVMLNSSGYSPAQWVLGQTPDDATSLTQQHFDANLGAHQKLVDLEEEPPTQETFMLQLLMRQAAKEAFVHVDSCNKVRKALLRKSVPMRGPYRVGNLLNFHRKGKWYGPARMLGYQGTSSIWLLHGGVTLLVPETSCRPASAEEIHKKNILELRPSRKRGRELMAEDEDIYIDDYVPFAEDGDAARHLRPRFEGQAPFVDILDADFPEPGPAVGVDAGVAAIPDQHPQQAEPMVPHEVPVPEPEMDDFEIHTPTELAESIVPSPSILSDLSGQPELEVSPETTDRSEETSSHPAGPPVALGPPQPPPGLEAASQTTPLTNAMRVSPARLDGDPRAFHSEEENQALNKEKQRIAFLASRQAKQVATRTRRYQKKNPKAGAGREVYYDKEPP